jgi:L-ascorbate metabolism protein UlaG (beta-lactamase superfamily)
MKPAFQTGDAFIADAQNALSAGKFSLWWLGQSGFLLVNNGRALVLDPYLSDSLTRKYQDTDKPHARLTQRVVEPRALSALGVIDAITSSHAHTDHFDAQTLQPLLSGNPQAKLILPAANRDVALERLGAGVAPRLIELDDGASATVAGIRFHGIAAAHNSVERDAKGRCKFLGYVVQWGGRCVYHSGDTLEHEGLVPALRKFVIDVALLPINGNLPDRRVAGNLDGPQAARLARDIGARWVTPCHYDMFEFNTASPGPFAAECERIGQPCRILRNGEGLDMNVC